MGDNLLTTGKFAKLCGTTKETLYYYREMGLLKPLKSQENGYFYYSEDQFFQFDMIRILRKCDCSVAEIKDYMANYGTKELVAILRDKQKGLQNKIQELQKIEALVTSAISTTEHALREPCGVPCIKSFSEIHFVVTQLPEQGTISYQMVAQYMNLHYEYCIQNGISQVYPMSTILSEAGMQNWEYIETHYASVAAKDCCAEQYMTMPAGDYAVIYHRGGYDTILDDFKCLLEFIEKNHLCIKGDGYATDMVGNLASIKFENFIIRIAVPVARRKIGV